MPSETYKSSDTPGPVRGPALDVPAGATFTSTFYDIVAKHPNLPALSAAWPDDTEMSYTDLATTAKGVAVQISRCFKSADDLKDAMVGIISARGIPFMCGLLGVLTAGGAFVPINPILPEERITWMLEDTEAPVLCVSSTALEVVPPSWVGTRVVLEDAIAAAPSLAEQAGGLRKPKPNDLMYVIFTSGSTGRPKGVLLEHGMALNTGLAFTTGTVKGTVKTGPGDRIFQFFSASFDPSIMDYMLALLTGATLCLGSDDRKGKPWQEVLSKSNPTVSGLVPTAMGVIRPAQLNGVKMLHCCGEAMPTALGTKWAASHTVLNCYGPTETTIYATVAHIHAKDKEIAIGYPMPNFACYIMDHEKMPELVQMPRGAVGELLIGGKGVARGYQKRPELTAEKWVDFEGDRLYRSGDLCRVREDGQIMCLGRADRQVKIQGYRIELGEIEDAASHHPQVRSACVVVHKSDAMPAPALFLYVMPVNGVKASDVNLGELKSELAVHLAPYMQPKVVVSLPELPMHPNGKVNFNALKENAKRDEHKLPKRGAEGATAGQRKSQGPAGGYDSLALTVDVKSAAKTPYEHFSGARGIASLFIIYAHYVNTGPPGRVIDDANRTPNLIMTWMNNAVQRTGGASFFMTIFAILAGFTCHMGNANRNLVKEGCRKYAHFALTRLDRLVFTMWFTEILATAVSWAHGHEGYKPGGMLLCMLTNGLIGIVPGALSWMNGPNGEAQTGCANGPGWFVGALWPISLAYPVLGVLVNYVSRRGETLGLIGLITVSFVLLMIVPTVIITYLWYNVFDVSKMGEYAVEHGPVSLIQNFPIFVWANFFLGCAVAELSRRHDLWSEENSWAEEPYNPEDKGSVWPSSAFLSAICNQPKSVFTLRRVRGLMADGTSILLALFFVFLPPPAGWCASGGAAKPDYPPYNGQVVFKPCDTEAYSYTTYVWTIAHLIFLYGSSANGKAGLTAKVLRHPLLVQLGNYALVAYLFQEPIAEILNCKRTPPTPNPSDVAGAEIFLTWAVAIAYTHTIETPCVLFIRHRLNACIDKCTCCSSSCCGGKREADAKDANV